jgi:hypothetical protein
MKADEENVEVVKATDIAIKSNEEEGRAELVDGLRNYLPTYKDYEIGATIKEDDFKVVCEGKNPKGEESILKMFMIK